MKRSSLLIAGVVAVAIGAGYGIGYWRNSDFSKSTISKTGFVGFEPGETHLGRHLWGETVSLQATFVNRGTESIIVESVKSSCGCTLIDGEQYKGKTVAAGEVLKLDIQFTTGKNPGAKRGGIDLRTTAGQLFSCSLQADVEGTWSLSADTLDFGEVVLEDSAGKDAEKALSFVSTSDELTGAQSNRPWLECHTAKRGSGKGEILVRVLKERLPAGVSTAYVTVQTSNSIRPTGVIYVKAKGVNDLTPSVGHVLLLKNQPKQVAFTRNDGQPVRLVSAEPTNANIRVKLLSETTLEVVNPLGASLTESVMVHVADQSGKTSRILVSTF